MHLFRTLLKSLLSGGPYFWRDRHFQDLLAKTKWSILSLFAGVATLGGGGRKFG